MEIKNIKIEEIKPYFKNAKKHTLEQICQVAESIRRFGFVQPVVVDKNNELIIGHCRVESAKTLGMIEVPAVVIDNLTDKEIKALRIADNKMNESEWDMGLVNEELKDLDDDLIGLAGFGDVELSDIDFENINSNEDREKKFKEMTVCCPECQKSFIVKV